jgi:hypothetical protein
MASIAKGAYEIAGQTWQSAYSDIGNTYHAVLTQNTGWHAARGGPDPMTQGISEEQTNDKDAPKTERGYGEEPKGIEDQQRGPDSGYGPGKADPHGPGRG